MPQNRFLAALEADEGRTAPASEPRRSRNSTPQNRFLAAIAEEEGLPSTAPEQRRSGTASFQARGDWGDSVSAGVAGLVDSVTFGYLDEIAAVADTYVPEALGGRGGTYEENLATNREMIDSAMEADQTAAFVGQIGGAFVGGAGLYKAASGVDAVRSIDRSARLRALRAGSSLRTSRLAGYTATGTFLGSVEAGLYGSGADDEGSRLDGAAAGALIGALGGLVLGGVVYGGRQFFARSRTRARLDTVSDVNPVAISISDDVAEEVAEGVARQGSLTADELPDGVLLTTRELFGDPANARRVLSNRIGRLSQEDAIKWAARLQRAEGEGTHLADPHYRSFFHVILPEGTTQDQILQSINVLEEASSQLAEKAGAARRSMAAIDGEARERMAQGVTVDDLSSISARSEAWAADARVASHAMTLAGTQFRQAVTRLMPDVRAGVEGSREALEEAITNSAQAYALSRGVLSNWGRAGRALQGDMQQGISAVADSLTDLTDDQVRKRVSKALRELDDDTVSDLVNNIRTADDAARFGDILMDAATAQRVSAWRRSMNSLTLAMKSNALTLGTGIFNIIGSGLNMGIRAAGRNRAARSALKAGRMDEAAMLNIERQLVREVRGLALSRGLQAMGKRMKWEAFEAGERVVGASSKRAAAASRAGRNQMLDEGYAPPSLREAAEEPRARVTDIEGLHARQASRGGGAAVALMNFLERTGASALNALDATASFGAKAFTGLPDELGRAYAQVTETMVENVRFAYREGVRNGLDGESLLAHVRTRSRELMEIPDGQILQRVEATLLKGDDFDDELTHLVRRQKNVDSTVRQLLFLDGPQTEFGRTSAQFAAKIDRGLTIGQFQGALMPYINTPIRLFENGLVKYTPWQAQAAENAAILRRGGPEAAILKAQAQIGLQTMGIGMFLASIGVLRVTDGEWKSTDNINQRRPNRIEIPLGEGRDFHVELGRADPFVTTLALGGILGQMLKDGVQDASEYGVEEGFEAAMSTALHGVLDSVLEKSYMQSFADAMDILLPRNGNDALRNAEKFYQNAATRLIPLSGVSRQFNESMRSEEAVQAITWTDKMLQHIPGAGINLPVRRNILGDPIEGRIAGIAAGIEQQDDVSEALEELGINLTDFRATDSAGFRLSSEQLSRLRELRGRVVRDEYGRSLRDNLRALMASEFFRTMESREGKRALIANIFAEYGTLARNRLMLEQPRYRAQRASASSFQEYLERGLSRDHAREGAEAVGRQIDPSLEEGELRF